MATKLIKPSNSYELTLPSSIEEKYEGGVSSFWMPGEQLLIQLSSFIRKDGEQIDAATRLRDRIEKSSNPTQWKTLPVTLPAMPNVDRAGSEITDENGVLWIHAYFVWPHLTVYVTISGPSEVVRNPGNWAFGGLRTMRPVMH
jgi:hypothetical protein